MRLAKVHMPEGSWIVSEFREVPTILLGEFCSVDVGDSFRVEIVEMSEKEYEALPDYEP